jgi:hypothetical protein
MSLASVFRKGGWWLGYGLCHCLNHLLALLAILQTGLILLNSLRTEVPMPDELAGWILHRVVGEDHQLRWAQVVFDLRGGLFLKDPGLYSAATGEPVLTARSLLIDLAPVNLLFGIGSPVDEVHAASARLHIPASLSRTGICEPVLEADHLHLLTRQGQFILKDLILQSGGLRLHLTGSAPLHRLPPKRPAKDRQLAPDALLQKLQQLPPGLKADGRISWLLDNAGLHQFSVRAFADSLELPLASFSQVLASARLESDGSSLRLLDLQAQGRLDSLPEHAVPDLPEHVQIRLPMPVSLSARGSTVPNGFLALPSQLKAILHQPLIAPVPVDRLVLEASLADPNPLIQWALHAPALFATGTAQRLADPPLPQFPFQVSLDASLSRPALRTFFPKLPQHRLLVDPRAGSLRLHASSSPDNPALTGLLVADDLVIGHTRFAHLHSRFSLSTEAFALSHAHVRKSPQEHASGSYAHHFASSRFALNATGSTFPAALDNLLGPWWQRIFAHIDAPDPPAADVTVWGLWRDREAIHSMTWVRGDGARYRGVAVPWLEVRVRSNGDWAYLEHLEGRFAEGTVSGRIGWRQQVEAGQARPMVLELRSDAPWSLVRAATGVAGLERLDISGRPQVEARGTLWRTPVEQGEPGEVDADEAVLPELALRLRHPEGSLYLNGIELRNLGLEGSLVGETLDFGRVTGELAGGVFTGRATFRNWGDPEQVTRQLDMQLFDAEYAAALATLAGLLGESQRPAATLLEEGVGGRLDADFSLRIGGSLEASRGAGLATLRQARIGRIHIFGGLSRVLDSMGLGFSTLELNDGTAQWRFTGSDLEITECLITGPVLNLRLAGQVDLARRDLDMQAEAFLFRGIMSKLLSPVSDNFQLDLSGPLESPVWSLRLNPLRWFQNRLNDGLDAAGWR